MKYPPREDMDYDAPAGGFADEECAVCGCRPCAVRVRWWETVRKPLSRTGRLRSGRSETHFFCATHRAASDRVYARFTRIGERHP